MNERTNSGEFYFHWAFGVFSLSEDPKLYHSDAPEDEKEFLKQCSIIDSHPSTGDFKMAFLHIDPAVSPPKIPDEVYFYNRGDYYRMGVDLPGYLEEGIRLKFINNWQYLLCDVSKMDPGDKRHIYNDLRTVFEDFKLIFPDDDFSVYKAILEEKFGGN